ncbi:MAG: hypothetical protein KBB54_00960 [Candidatus Pacebacteria bacterium]|nr:hypothetical protein [Candidatus Paceibacterota bacterium]MBP9818362.1 hypothetical protein [Candidatus Paceibacterota bacterium]
MKSPSKNSQNGQVIIGALLLFLTISITVLVGIATPVAIQVRTAADFLQSKQGYISADVLNEEALYRLNQGRTLPSTLVLSFNDATSTALITDVGGAKQVIATGISGAFTRLSKSIFSQGEGISINYGLQVGDGGLTMSGSPTITGNVISNGNISGSGVSTITGSAIASTASVQTTDQSNGSGVPAVNTTFGNANATQDFAQSFTVSTTTPVARVMLYIKKTGTPANATVRITTTSGGNPTNTTLMSGTLSATQVTTSYGWVPVNFTSNVALVPGTTYWLMVDVSSNSTTNTYVMGVSNTNSYTAGSVKTGRYSNGSSWTAASANNDAFFQLYLGGVSSISGMVVNGNATAYTVNNSTVSGTLSCQSGTGNNKVCNTSSSTPTTTTFPFSESNIAEWKADATAGGVYTGNITLDNIDATSTGALKINGNLTITDAARMTISGTLYITGNLSVQGDTDLVLNSSVGANSVVIVVDGTVNIGNAANVSGSGTAGSYMMIVTTSSCGGLTSCSGTSAVSLGGAAGAVVLLAPNGQVAFTGSASAKAVVAYKMSLVGATRLNYESGLADIEFNSGPSGSWVTDSWKEIYQ